MKNVILLFGSFGTFIILITGCVGGGINPFGKKPVCGTPSFHATIFEFKGYKPFVSQKYKCVNGNFESDGDEFKCVPPVCLVGNESNFSYVVDGDCGWQKTDIIKHYRNGNYYTAKSFSPSATCLEKATCKTNNTVTLDLIPKWYQVFGGGECGPLDKKSDDPSQIEYPTPGDELTSNIGEFSDNPGLDPVIRNPTKPCTQGSSYRLENGFCTQATTSPEYAMMQSCLDELYVDNSIHKFSDKSQNSRKFEIAFRIDNYIKDYAIAVIKSYNGLGGVTKNSLGILQFISKIKIKDCNRWNSNLSGIATGLWTADLDIANGVSDGDKVSTVLLLKNAQGTYDPVGTYCDFTVRTKENRTPTPTPNQRVLNLLVFKNASESNFKSDITQYNYYNSNLNSTASFTSSLEAIWKYELHASSVNYTYHTLPTNLVDANGNAVLWEKDIPMFKYIDNNNEVKERRKVFNASLPDTDPSKITSRDFSYLRTMWRNRMIRYNRLLGGKTDNTSGIGTDKNVDLSKVTMEILNDDKGSREYANLIAMVVVNSFSIRNEDGITFDTNLNNSLTKYIEDYRTANKLQELADNGVTYAAKEPYSPLCVVFSIINERIFLPIEPELKGAIIINAMHEIGHGWYYSKSTSLELLAGDGYENYFRQHVAYNYNSSRSECDHDYYCFMKPQADSKKILDVFVQRDFIKKQIINNNYSKGVLERLRNVFSASY